MRKARILAVKGESAKALSSLQGLPANTHKSALEELRGDLYLQSGETAKARASYQAALTAAGEASKRPLLEIKLNDLTVEEG